MRVVSVLKSNKSAVFLKRNTTHTKNSCLFSLCLTCCTKHLQGASSLIKSCKILIISRFIYFVFFSSHFWFYRTKKTRQLNIWWIYNIKNLIKNIILLYFEHISSLVCYVSFILVQFLCKLNVLMSEHISFVFSKNS